MAKPVLITKSAYNKLVKRNEQLQADNDKMKLDSAYGILTRPGLEIEYRNLTGEMYAVFIDLDKIHELNNKHGSQEPVDKMIRRAFKMRHDDLLLAGRWKSGDEIVFIVKTDPDGFSTRLQSNLKRHGLSATCSAAKIENHDLQTAVNVAMKKVYAAKKSNHRGGRV